MICHVYTPTREQTESPSLPGAPGVTVAGAKVGRHPIHARHGAATAATAVTGAQLQLTGEDQFAHRLAAAVMWAPKIWQDPTDMVIQW